MTTQTGLGWSILTLSNSVKVLHLSPLCNETEIENLLQDIKDLKEELEIERGKSMFSINNKISLEHFRKRLNVRNLGNEKRCRYWNRGLCKEGDECQLYHAKEDCEMYSRTGKCF